MTKERNSMKNKKHLSRATVYILPAPHCWHFISDYLTPQVPIPRFSFFPPSLLHLIPKPSCAPSRKLLLLLPLPLPPLFELRLEMPMIFFSWAQFDLRVWGEKEGGRRISSLEHHQKQQTAVRSSASSLFFSVFLGWRALEEQFKEKEVEGGNIFLSASPSLTTMLFLITVCSKLFFVRVTTAVCRWSWRK